MCFCNVTSYKPINFFLFLTLSVKITFFSVQLKNGFISTIKWYDGPNGKYVFFSSDIGCCDLPS